MEYALPVLEQTAWAYKLLSVGVLLLLCLLWILAELHVTSEPPSSMSLKGFQ